MNALFSALLGLIQGITEFLPVSSSAHLAIFQNIWNINPGLLLDIGVHFGTALAVIIVYRGYIWKIISEFFLSLIRIVREKSKVKYEFSNSKGFRFVILLIITSIPAAIAGFFLEDKIVAMFESMKLIGIALIITGILLWASDKLKRGEKKDILQVSPKNALVIGIAQAIAVFPGISRSGMTITASLASGLDRSLAANYSFIASLPIIIGAMLSQLIGGALEAFTMGMGVLLIGIFVAFISGLVAIKFVKKLVVSNKYRYFSFYLWIVGILLIIFG